MKYNYLWTFLFVTSISVADIPDITLSWESFFIIETYDTKNIIDCTLAENDANSLLVLVVDSASNYTLLELNLFGEITQSSIHSDSTITQLKEFTPLMDGGYLICKLGVASPADKITIRKFNQNNQEIWNRNIFVDSADNLEINSVIELENNNILLTGTSNGLNFRGVNICLDSSGDELWQRTDWYFDFTSFQNALQRPNGNCLISGCTASENEETFGPGEMNVLLVEINDSGELITGIEIQNSTGSQQPLFTFSINDKIIVIGRNISSESDETELFLGIVEFPQIDE